MRLHRLACLLPLVLAAAAPVPSGVVGSIALPDGGWDYASVDPASNTLYVARTDGVDMVDLATRATRRLAPAQRAHAVLPIPGTHLLLQTDGTSNTARLIDTGTGAIVQSIAVGTKPDAATWDAALARAIVMNQKSGTLSVIDPATAQVTATIQLDPGLESAALDSRGVLFVNNEDSGKMTAVDLTTGKRIADIALPGCEGPTGIAYAAWADRLVASCETIAAVVDPKTMKFVAALPIGTGPDAVIADPAHKRLFVPAGSTGDVSVIELRGGKLTVTRRIATGKTARTGAYDPKSGHLFLPSATFAAPVPPAKRGVLVPGSVKLLEVQP